LITLTEIDNYMGDAFLKLVVSKTEDGKTIINNESIPEDEEEEKNNRWSKVSIYNNERKKKNNMIKWIDLQQDNIMINWKFDQRKDERMYNRL